MLLMQARLIQAVANRIADGCTRLMARSLLAVLVFTPTLAQATALPGDIKTLSCVAGKLGELILWSDPRPRLRAWAISSLVKDAYGIRAFEAEQLELTDPEAAKSKRAEAIRLLKIAKEAGWDHLKSIALNPRAAASDELALAYWTSAAWGALIALDRDDFDALADWPKAKALADWVRQQQADFGEGAALMLAASFEWSSPGGDKAQAKLWFTAVLNQYGAKQAMPHVFLAEQLDLDAGDRQAFEDRLRLAIKVAEAYPSFENRVAASKALWLLDRIDSLF